MMQAYILDITFTAIFSLLIFNYARILSSRVNSGDVEESVNLAMVVGILAFVGFAMFTAVEFGVLLEDSPWTFFSNLLLILIPCAIALVCLLTTAIQRARGKPIFFMMDRLDIIEKIRNRKNKALHDLGRKLWHILLFLAMSIAFFQGYYWMYDVVSSTPGQPIAMVYALRSFWGSNGLGFSFLDPEYLGVSNMLIFLVFYIQFMLSSIMEFCRFSRKFDFPFLSTLAKGLRASEIEVFGSHVYMAAGFLFASFFLPPLGLLAIFGLSCFGDTAAAQVGMRVGKHKLGFNRKKSWEGLIAGAITSYIAASLFVGWIWSGVATAVFVAVDALTSNRLKASDNIAFPVFVTIAFLAFSLFQIPYAPLIAIPRI